MPVTKVGMRLRSADWNLALMPRHVMNADADAGEYAHISQQIGLPN